MDRVGRCLSQIEAIRSVAAGDVPPYVARSRIGRLAASVSTLATSVGGLRGLSVDDEFIPSFGGSSQTKELTSCLRRLRDASRHVAQPSEPLDNRWRRSWGELLKELSVLEDCIKKASSNGRAT